MITYVKIQDMSPSSTVDVLDGVSQCAGSLSQTSDKSCVFDLYLNQIQVQICHFYNRQI